jgi:hypothetical protein
MRLGLCSANLHQVAESVAEDYDQLLETVLADVQATMAQMAELDVVELVA